MVNFEGALSCPGRFEFPVNAIPGFSPFPTLDALQKNGWYRPHGTRSVLMQQQTFERWR
jgi:hypothetical protein